MTPRDEAQALLDELTALKPPEDNTTLNPYADLLGEIARRAKGLPSRERFVVDETLTECMNRLWSLRAASIGEPEPLFIPPYVRH
jgi:hypothetical protein